MFQPLPNGWTSFIYCKFHFLAPQKPRRLFTYLTTVLSGGLHVGNESAERAPHHTIVLSANEGEDGVWLEATQEGLTRGVLIAGEPLKQNVVQVGHATQAPPRTKRLTISVQYGPFVTTSMQEVRQAIEDCKLDHSEGALAA